MAAEENGIHSEIKVKVQEQLGAVEVEAEEGTVLQRKRFSPPRVRSPVLLPHPTVLEFDWEVVILKTAEALVCGIYFREGTVF